MGSFTTVALIVVFFFLVMYSISPPVAGIVGLVLLVAFLKELVTQWRDKN